MRTGMQCFIWNLNFSVNMMQYYLIYSSAIKPWGCIGSCLVYFLIDICSIIYCSFMYWQIFLTHNTPLSKLYSTTAKFDNRLYNGTHTLPTWNYYARSFKLAETNIQSYLLTVYSSFLISLNRSGSRLQYGDWTMYWL